MDNNQRLCEAIQILKQIQIKRNEGDSELQKYLGSCLRTAAKNNNLDLVKRLIEEENANPNDADINGSSSLILATRYKHFSVLEYLLSLSDKVNINAQDSMGSTALHIACDEDFEHGVMILLCSPRLDVNIVDDNGHTALVYAVCDGKIEIVRCLLEHKDIDVNFENQSHRNRTSALSLACREEHNEIISMLLQREDLRMSSRNLKLIIQFVMKRPVKKNIGAVIEKAVTRNFPGSLAS